MVLFWLFLVVHVLCTPKNFLSIILVFLLIKKKKKGTRSVDTARDLGCSFSCAACFCF